MDIRHCFVPYLPGILENETVLLNEKVIVENEIEPELKLSLQTREVGRGEVEVEGEISIGNEEGKMVEMKNGVEKEPETKKITERGTKNDVKKKVEKEVEKKVVIMAKHLCGVATDLALRSLDAFIIPTTTLNSTSALKQNGGLDSNGKSSYDFII